MYDGWVTSVIFVDTYTLDNSLKSINYKVMSEIHYYALLRMHISTNHSI